MQNSPENTPASQHTLRKGLGFWELTFQGQHAVFKHEQGAYFRLSTIHHQLLRGSPRLRHSNFGFRPSDFFRISDFGLRILPLPSPASKNFQKIGRN